jgi:hypothetical protein
VCRAAVECADAAGSVQENLRVAYTCAGAQAKDHVVARETEAEQSDAHAFTAAKEKEIGRSIANANSCRITIGNSESFSESKAEEKSAGSFTLSDTNSVGDASAGSFSISRSATGKEKRRAGYAAAGTDRRVSELSGERA